MMEGHHGAGMCSCPHHKIVPLLVVAFGVLFLGGTLGWWGANVVTLGWPILVIIAGGSKLFSGFCKCC
ncbi:MAG: hypothetical protein HYS74_00395 [Parcubacteria group bacterium]|nr:hypothetical protein [Parcubacteria group bacterium]